MCKTLINALIETKITNRADWKKLTDLFFYEPGGTSTKNLMHWIQLYDTQELAEFDYGKKENIKIYGTEKPPKYNVQNWKSWKIPSFITFSDADPYSVDEDTNYFLNHVENKDNFVFKRLKNYNHLDYIWSEDAKNDLYYDIFSFLDK